PAALINLVDDERHLEDGDAAKLTQLVVSDNAPLVVHTADQNERIGDNSYLLTNGIDFYVGVPLVGEDGGPIGALALLDYEPRESFTEEDTARLEQEAAELGKTFR